MLQCMRNKSLQEMLSFCREKEGSISNSATSHFPVTDYGFLNTHNIRLQYETVRCVLDSWLTSEEMIWHNRCWNILKLLKCSKSNTLMSQVSCLLPVKRGFSY